MFSFKVFMLIFLFYNLYVFLVVMRDKRRAEQSGWRTPEFNLLIMGFALGGIGLFAGMYVFKHKTSSLKFKIGVPLLIAWNIFALGYLYFSGHFNG